MIFNQNNLVEGLNPQQQKAVMSTEGPLLIVAGAGSGKTRVLTNRIAHLVQNRHVKPWQILGITFTNKAAKEMRERVTQVVTTNANDIWLSTFHSLCVRILRKDIDRLGYTKAFTIIDSTDQINIVKKVMIEDLNLDIKKFQPREMLSKISAAKNNLISSKTFLETTTEDYLSKIVGEVYEGYQEMLIQNQLLDFDDLIMKTVELFNLCPEILLAYQERFKYIHVDEWQDTNHAQYTLVNMLASKYRNLCVVGDSDQGIYSWRGADIRNILSFEKDYPEAVVILLEQNYRSTKVILEAANSVISNNVERKDKQLWTENMQGNQIHHFNAEDEQAEALHVTEQIKKAVDSGERKYSDFAVLYRTNAQSRIIEEVFMKSTISYKMVGGTKFYDRMEIKDILAFLRLIANPNDNLSLIRIINVPKRGIGKTTISQIEQYARKNKKSMFDSLFEIQQIGITPRSIKKLTEFRDMVQRWVQMQDYMSVTSLLDDILESTGYRNMYTGTAEGESRLENIDEFLSITQHFEKDSQDTSLIAFLTDLALISDIDTVDDEDDQVLLMTVHGAKGLEYPVVFLIGMEEGIFPHNRSLLEPEQMQEERRLAYVAITRAEEQLFITSAKKRTLYGRTSHNETSRFVKEIPEDLIEGQEEDTQLTMSNDLTSFNSISEWIDNVGEHLVDEKPAEKEEWIIGITKISHAKWGRGIVVNVKGKGDSTEIDVTFPNIGVRRLLVKFAPIERVY